MTYPGQSFSDPGSGGGDTRNANINLDANVAGYVAGMNQANQSTTRLASSLDALDQKLASISHRASQKLVSFEHRDFAVLGAATADAATFQKQLGTLAATSAVLKTSLAGTKGAIESTFTSLPTSRTQLVQLAETLDELGVKGSRNLQTLLATFVKLGAATGEGPNELAQGLLQLSRLMGQTDAGQITNFANSLLTVSKNSGVSATGVLSFAQAIAPLARQAGIGEASVLGISAAFSKAGADGYVAANTFNKIVGDITQLTQSGSPELAKYANLIGVTVGQFKSMDKTTALQQIFQTISSQGPQAINTLNRLGIDGVRAQSAIAAVVQSGGLSQAISQAQGSAGNHSNLDRGASAAMHNLADNLTSLRNEFTQFGTVIGTTFLKPLELGTRGLTEMMHVVNMLIKPFSTLVSSMGVAGGVISGVAGFGLAHAGVIGAVALGRMALRSGPRRAFSEGLGAGRPMAGETEEEAIARAGATASGRQLGAYRAGEARMPLLTRVAYGAGLGAGQLRAPTTEEELAARAAARGAGGPSGLAQAARGAIRGPLLAAGGLIRGQSTFMADARGNDYARSAYQAKTTPGFGEQFTAQKAANKASVEEESALRALAKGTWDVTKAFAELGVQTARTGASILTGGRVGGARVAEEDAGRMGAIRSSVGRLGRTAGAAAGGLVGSIGGVAGALGPLGVAGIGVPLALQGYSAFSGAVHRNDDITDALNPLKKLNDQFGIATTNVANFSTKIQQAASNIPAGDTKAATIAAASVLQPGAISAGRTTKVTDENLKALGKYAKNDTASQLSYLQSLGITDPATLQALQPQLVKAFGARQAGTLLQAYGAAPGAAPDLDRLGVLISGSEGRGSGALSRSKSGKVLAGAAATSIQVQDQNDISKYGSKYADTRELGNIVRFASGVYANADLNTDQGSKAQDQLSSALSTLLGGGSYYAKPGAMRQRLRGESQSAREKDIVSIIGRTKQGQAFLSGTGTTDPSAIAGLLPQLAAQGESPLNRSIRGVGALGSFALNSSVVQGAVNAPDSPHQQFQAMMSLYNAAGGASGKIQDMVKSFDGLKGAIQDTSNPLYQLADAASQYAQQQASFSSSFQSRPQQLATSAGLYQTAQATAAGPNAPPDAQQNLMTAQASYQQQVQAQTAYEIQAYQQAKAFGVQMERGQEDENHQLAISQRDFYKSQLYSQQDFQRQTLRAQQDYATQLKRQAEAEAQSIYNPFQRVQAQYTNSAATVVQNLQDQNMRIAQQLADLQRLRKEGVSQQSIDTLALADPNNAQQTHALVASIANDPALIRQINAEVGKRLSATTALTQSSFSLQFRQTGEDFTKQMSRAVQDYQTAQGRALDAQQTSLGDMAYSYRLMVSRSADDMNTAMTEVYGNFGQNYGKTLATINAQIGKYSPALAKMLTTELKAMNDAINGVTPPAVIAAARPGMNPVNAPSNSTRGQSRAAGTPHAMGAISTRQHTGTISENNRPEMILPLDARGQQFMAGMYQGISMLVVRTMQARQYASAATGPVSGGSGSVKVDASTQYNGPITVQASDPEKMERELAKRKRLKALARPAMAI